MKPYQIALTRRLALVLGLATLAVPRMARAKPPGTPTRRLPDLRASLDGILPRALDPGHLGAALHTPAPVCLADCLHHAGTLVPEHAWVAAQVAEDFARGRVVNVNGWRLSHTEAWLCAAIHAQENPPAGQPVQARSAFR